MTKQQPGTVPARRLLLSGALVVLLVTLAYIPSLGGGFLWDDDANVTDNLALRSLEGLRRIWLEPGATQQYYPLTYTSFWVDRHLFGSRPVFYRLENVLIHALVAVLLWRLLAMLRVPGAWFGAAVFGLHPVCVESVAWVTERKNTLSGLFFLGSLIAATRFWLPTSKPVIPAWQAKTTGKAAHEEKLGIWKYYCLALLLYFGALASKTSTIGLPAIILLLVWWRRGKVSWRDVVLVLPFCAVGLVMGLTTIKVERSMGANGEYWNFSTLERGLIACRDLWFYAGKLVWPHPLTFFYPRWVVRVSSVWTYLPVAGVVAGLAWFWHKREGWGRTALFVTGYFVVALFPVLGFFDVSFFQFSFVADHLQYLACMAPLALAGALIAIWLKRAHRAAYTRRLVGGGVAILLGFLTWRQAEQYQNPEALWRTTLAHNPASWTAHYNLGSILARNGELEGALRQYETAAKLDPNPTYAHFSLGNFQAAWGDFNAAVHEYEAALSLQPNFAKVRINLGNLFYRKGDRDAAERQFRMVLQTEPHNPDAHYNLGNTLAGKGMADEAAQEYRETLSIASDYVYAHFSLANLLAAKGDLSRAVEEYRRALQLDPENSEAHYNLGNVLSAQGDMSGAIQEFTLALDANTNYMEAFYNRGNVRARKGDLDGAIRDYTRVLAIRPDFAQAHFNLGNFLAANGRLAEAREHFGIALRLKPDFAEARQQLQAVVRAEEQATKREGH